MGHALRSSLEICDWHQQVSGELVGCLLVPGGLASRRDRLDRHFSRAEMSQLVSKGEALPLPGLARCGGNQCKPGLGVLQRQAVHGFGQVIYRDENVRLRLDERRQVVNWPFDNLRAHSEALSSQPPPVAGRNVPSRLAKAPRRTHRLEVGRNPLKLLCQLENVNNLIHRVFSVLAIAGTRGRKDSIPNLAAPNKP